MPTGRNSPLTSLEFAGLRNQEYPHAFYLPCRPETGAGGFKTISGRLHVERSSGADAKTRRSAMADAASDWMGKKSGGRGGPAARKERGSRTGPREPGEDRPFIDTTAYGSGPDDSITDSTENAAITHHVAMVNGTSIPYTATAGHLVTVDPSSSKPAAKFFYVAFTADGAAPASRPVTFFYNGGPGSSSVFLLLGSFAPRRIKTNMPGFTPPPPYAMEDNPDSLIDRSDLVYINPVGTGYSAAIAPFRNRDFWGVDQDAVSIKQFIKRYLSAFNRWNSPRFLFGESYGTARSCVLAWLLHEDGLDLNGVTLQSSVLDYPANFSNAAGLMPTFAADAWYHGKIGVEPPPADLPAFMDTVCAFAQGPYAKALKSFPDAKPSTVRTLSRYLGLPASMIEAWHLNVEAADRLGHSAFLIELLRDKGLALGAYDGRVTGIDTGIAAIVSPDGGMNDPTMAAVSGVYTTMWNSYLANDLKFTATANFVDLNDQAFQFWDFTHTDPAGAVQKPDRQGNPTLYTAGDLAATMAANPDLLVLSANGYYDSVTPFFQTRLTLDAMPLVDAHARANLTIRNYPSGHMIYLDGASRTALKADLAAMYDRATARNAARLRAMAMLPGVVPNIVRPYFKLPHAGGAALKPAAAGAVPWSVPDLCRAYSWPTGLVGGGVIAILEFNGGWIGKDIEAYFRAAGLPAPDIADVTVGAGRNDPNRHSGDPAGDPDREVALDIEIAGAAYSVATGKAAAIRVYWGDAADWGAMASAITAAAADGCDVCSISWGSDEANWRAAARATGVDFPGRLNEAAQAAARSGMIVFAASGDNDSSDGGTDPANVDLPSSSPFAVGCGGTMKPHDPAEAETVWNDDPGNPNGEGTGGGFSELFRPMPAWQAGAPHGPGRMVPDISANADPETGYEVFVHGGRETVGGTSAVAPLYAGLFAAFGRKLGRVAPRLWLNQACFNDITRGDNGFYRARTGPDPCTGLGSPIADRLGALFGASGKSSSGRTGASPAVPKAPSRGGLRHAPGRN
jgi:carboxypeptidase C (cathepsin A)